VLHAGLIDCAGEPDRPVVRPAASITRPSGAVQVAFRVTDLSAGRWHYRAAPTVVATGHAEDGLVVLAIYACLLTVTRALVLKCAGI